MLLAEELALIALDGESGRHAIGIRDKLNACLAGLLIVEVQLSEQPEGPVLPESPVLKAAREILAEAGPKLKPVLSAMNSGLERRIGYGTWEAIIEGLVVAEIVAPADGTMRPRHRILDVERREEIIGRLRAAAAGDDPMAVRTAVLLSMTGPAQLLEVVAPDRSTRKHARRRIDHALDATAMEPVAQSVRKVLQEAAAAVATVAAVTAASSSS